MNPLFLAPFLGIGVGLALGLLGGGGSILMVPILVYILGQDAQAAVVTSLVIVGTNALIGTGMHWRAGHIQLRKALSFGGASMVGAYLSATLAKALDLPDALVLALFGLLMLVVGGLMLRPPRVEPSDTSRPPGPLWHTLLTGFSVGILTGFLGVGGGFVIVPALVLVLGMPMADAVGTSLLVIVMSATAGLAGYFPLVGLDWQITGIFVVSGLAGLALGTYWSKIWPAQRLRRAFATMVVGLALVLLVQNVPLLFGPIG
jgi:hypothetical protein